MGAKFLAILSALLFTLQLCAQLNSDTVQTKEDLLLLERNARLSLTKALIVEDMDSIRYWRDLHVIRELKKGPRERELFDPRSRAVLNFQLGDVDALLEDIRRGEHYFNFTGYGFLSEVVTHRFLDVWALRTDLILDKIESVAILPQERDLLMVYWMAAFNHLHAYSYGIAYSQQYINEQANLLLGTELDHANEQFLRDHIRQEYEASRNMLGFSATAGIPRFTPSLDKHIDPSLFLNFRGEAFYPKFQVFYNLYMMGGRSSGPVQLDTLQLTRGNRLSWMGWSGGAGVVLFDTRATRSILSGGIHASRMNHQLADTTHRTRFFFGPIAELAFDIKLSRNRSTHAEWKGVLGEWKKEKRSVEGLRLLIGYSHNAVSRHFQHSGGMFTFSIGVFTYIRRPSRRR